jgi:hypothetical protein
MRFREKTKMKRQIVWGAIVAIALATTNAVGGVTGGGSSSSANSVLLLLGPVEAVKQRDGIVVVLGQKLPQRAVGSVEIGETLAVFGTVRADGTLSVSGVRHFGLYVPGATSVVLSGVVQKVSTALGRAIIAGLTVDLTAATALDSSQTIATGTFVQVSGTQPALGGLILAQGVTGGGTTNGVTGGGTVSGVTGGGTVSGVTGGGTVSGVTGGGTVSGVTGGGVVNGVTGGGKLSGVTGGGTVNGVTGGGTLSGVTGGGVVNGVTGGGKLSGVTGGGTVNGVTGGGVVNGVTGGGLTRGVTGGGR